MPPDRARLLALAEARLIDDPAVRAAWPAVVTAIRSGWLLPDNGPYSIPATIDQLQRTGLVSVEEYALEDDDQGSDSLLVTLIGDTRRVPRESFLRSLRGLDDEFRAAPGPGGAPPPRDEPGLPEPALIRQALQELLGAASQAPETPESKAVRREAQQELERLATTPDDDVRAAIQGLASPDRERFAAALRAFAAWSEQPERRGDRVDAVIRDLEETLGRLLPGRRAEARETDARIRESARDAIARRLRGV